MNELPSSDEEESAKKRRKTTDSEDDNEKESPEELKDSQNYEISSFEDDGEESEEEEHSPLSDPHSSHFDFELPEGFAVDKIQYQPPQHFHLEEVGGVVHHKMQLLAPLAEFNWTDFSSSVGGKDLSELGLKKNLLGSLEGSEHLTTLQLNFLRLLANYYDVSYMQRTYRKGEALRKVYTLHILNHILKSRAKIVHHNSKLAKDPEAEFRDQGFTRPVALVLVPFRHDCHRIVRCVTQLLPPGCVISNKRRFEKEYGPPPKRNRMKKKPQDYEQTFEGNIDEDFKIGLSIKNKSVSLYSEFFRSDLIIASPLGLRQALDGGSADFLSSVEVLVVDRVDVLYVQNVVHLMHVLDNVNKLPKESHGCDFSRVRTYACDGLSKVFRQTVLLSSVEHRWFESVLLRNYCANYAGHVCSAHTPKTLGISHVYVTLKLCFRLFEFRDPAKEFDDRFQFFVDRVLPDFLRPEMSQTLVFVPSYFDFVRLRNHFREKEISATMVCEYSSAGKVAEARNNFFKGRRHFLLYTERAHFYNRYSLKGVQHLLFYQPPTYPSFFNDLQFFLLDSNPRRQLEERSCTVLTSALDFVQLRRMVGDAKARGMVASKEKVFVQQIVR